MMMMTSSVTNEVAEHHFFESCSRLAVQLDNYLSSASTSVERLASYPHVTNALIKPNSMLQSSAAVQRLFSAAGQILVACRCCKLSDEHFDVCVFERLSKNT